MNPKTTVAAVVFFLGFAWLHYICTNAIDEGFFLCLMVFACRYVTTNQEARPAPYPLF